MDAGAGAGLVGKVRPFATDLHGFSRTKSERVEIEGLLRKELVILAHSNPRLLCDPLESVLIRGMSPFAFFPQQVP